MGAFYILSAIFIWSSLGVVVRLSGVAVHVLIFYSALVSVFLQGLILAGRGHRSSIPRARGVVHLLLLGPLMLLNLLTFFFAFKNTTISNAILTHYIAPVLVAFLAPVFLRETITRRAVFSIAVATLGLWILLGMNPLDLVGPWERPSRDTLGIMSGLFSGFTYALIIIVTRVYAQSYAPLAMCFFQNLMISLILLPFVRVFPVEALWSFLFMGLLHSTLAPVLYFKGMGLVRANRAAILGYIEPVGAIIFGIMFFREYPAPQSIVGGVLIIYSGYLTLKGE
jgi:drug/metabolite transporter (DMT)-like permease